MVNLTASLGIKAIMNTSEVDRGCEKIKGLLTGVGRKAKETNVFFERTTGILGELTGLAKGFGLGLLGALTGVVAASPHFKAFMASLKGPWYKLTQYLGSQFKPMLDKVSVAFKGFVSWFSTDEGIRDLLGFLAETGGRTIDIAVEFLGGAAGLLFGDDSQMGLIPWIAETYEGIKRTLNVEVNAETETKALLAGVALLAGHPWIAAALTVSAVAGVAKGAGITDDMSLGHQIGRHGVLGGMQKFGESWDKWIGERSLMEQAGIALTSIPGLVGVSAHYGTQWGQQASQGLQNIIITIEDYTRGGVSAAPKTANVGLEVSI